MSAYRDSYRAFYPLDSVTTTDMARAFADIFAPYRWAGTTAVNLVDLLIPNGGARPTLQQWLAVLHMDRSAASFAYRQGPAIGVHPAVVSLHGVEFVPDSDDEAGYSNGELRITSEVKAVLRNKFAHLPREQRNNAMEWFEDLIVDMCVQANFENGP